MTLDEHGINGITMRRLANEAACNERFITFMCCLDLSFGSEGVADIDYNVI